MKGGCIIMAASGMCDAGRIRHHLRNNLFKKEATVLCSSAIRRPARSAASSSDGEEDVRIHGREVKVNARIRRIGNYSAHADQGELIAWIKERHAGSMAGFS